MSKDQNPFVEIPQEEAEILDLAHEEALRYRGDAFSEMLEQMPDPDFERDARLALRIAERVRRAGGRVLVVGGFVRDMVMRRYGYGKTSKDIDLEIYYLDKEGLMAVLQEVAGDPAVLNELGMKSRIAIDEVGKQFGVLVMLGLDIAVTRRDSRTKQGEGRKPEVICDPTMEPEQAAFRRDLTINSMGMDPLTGEIIDHYDGMDDIRAGVIRHIYDGDPRKTQFGDDPLRVLRVMQFAARFDYAVAPETVELCREMDLSQLAKERVGGEWNKMLLKSTNIRKGLEVAREIGVLDKLHPELSAGVSDEEVWENLLQTMEQAGRVADRDSLGLLRKKRLLYETLLLRVNNPKKFLVEIKATKDDANAIIGLLEIVKSIDLDPKEILSDEQIRRLSFAAGKIQSGVCFQDLLYLFWMKNFRQSDENERDALQNADPVILKIAKRAKELHVFVEPPKCILDGADLKMLGISQGAKMGEILRKTMEMQLKGVFDNEDFFPQKDLAITWVEENFDL